MQWNHLLKERPDDSSVDRAMERWVRKGVFEAVWVHLVEVCDDLGGVDSEWQAAGACLGEATAVGTVPAPTPPIEPRGA